MLESEIVLLLMCIFRVWFFKLLVILIEIWLMIFVILLLKLFKVIIDFLISLFVVDKFCFLRIVLSVLVSLLLVLIFWSCVICCRNFELLVGLSGFWFCSFLIINFKNLFVLILEKVELIVLFVFEFIEDEVDGKIDILSFFLCCGNVDMNYYWIVFIYLILMIF